MPYLEIKDNDNKVYQKFTFKSEQSIITFIRNIKTKDLKEKSYRFFSDYNDLDSDMQLEYFFNTNYNHKFFRVVNGVVELLVLPNGLHRELKSKNRKSFNNRILYRTLERTLENIIGYTEKKYLKFDNNRIHFIKFFRDDYYHISGHMAKRVSFIEVWFDKLTWTYKIGEVTLYDAFFLKDLTNALEKSTKYLREYRKKKQDENNIE